MKNEVIYGGKRRSRIIRMRGKISKFLSDSMNSKNCKMKRDRRILLSVPGEGEINNYILDLSIGLWDFCFRVMTRGSRPEMAEMALGCRLSHERETGHA